MSHRDRKRSCPLAICTAATTTEARAAAIRDAPRHAEHEGRRRRASDRPPSNEAPDDQFQHDTASSRPDGANLGNPRQRFRKRDSPEAAPKPRPPSKPSSSPTCHDPRRSRERPSRSPSQTAAGKAQDAGSPAADDKPASPSSASTRRPVGARTRWAIPPTEGLRDVNGVFGHFRPPNFARANLARPSRFLALMVDDGICWSGAQRHPEALGRLGRGPCRGRSLEYCLGYPALAPRPSICGRWTIKAQEPGGTLSNVCPDETRTPSSPRRR